MLKLMSRLVTKSLFRCHNKRCIGRLYYNYSDIFEPAVFSKGYGSYLTLIEKDNKLSEVYVGYMNKNKTVLYEKPVYIEKIVDGMTVEISAVNGRFTLDFLQTFSNPIFVNAFLKELEENGIVYDLQDVNELELANILLPWTE